MQNRLRWIYFPDVTTDCSKQKVLFHNTQLISFKRIQTLFCTLFQVGSHILIKEKFDITMHIITSKLHLNLVLNVSAPSVIEMHSNTKMFIFVDDSGHLNSSLKPDFFYSPLVVSPGNSVQNLVT